MVNLQGRTYMQPIDNPFTEADRLLDEASEPLPPIRLVDFHCEITSEKNALGLYLDGRVSAVVGTHTHVVTGDERILPKGTAYQTDLGMTGPIWSVIGFNPATVLPRFINALPTRFEVGDGPVIFNACQVDVDPATGRALQIERIGDRRRGLTRAGATRRARATGAGEEEPFVPGAAVADLHAHTLRSDGVLEPRELVRQAHAAGVRLFAIADHDNLAAYRELTAPGAPPLPDGLDLVPAVEINAVTRGLDLALPEGELHVLGIGVDPDDAAFEAAIASQRGARRLRFTATSRACATSACRSTPTSTPPPWRATTRSAGRPSPAPSWPPATPRPSRTRSTAGSPGACPATCRGPGWVRSRRSTRSVPRAASRRSRTSVRRRDRIRSCGS